MFEAGIKTKGGDGRSFYWLQTEHSKPDKSNVKLTDTFQDVRVSVCARSDFYSWALSEELSMSHAGPQFILCLK